MTKDFMSQTEIIRDEILSLIKIGTRKKTKIFNIIDDKYDFPRPTIRRVASHMRKEFAELLEKPILDKESKKHVKKILRILNQDKELWRPNRPRKIMIKNKPVQFSNEVDIS